MQRSSAVDVIPGTPSSDDSDKDSRRNCSYCKSRMSSLFFDKHSLCSSCRGGDCDIGAKCKECMVWPDDEFAKYLKHRKTLDAKSKHRKDKKKDGTGKGSKGDSSRPVNVDESNNKPKGALLGHDNDSADVAMDPGVLLSRDQVVDLVKSSVGDFGDVLKAEVASHLRDAFSDINAILERRLGPEGDVQDQDATNPLISDVPTLAPVRPLLGQKHQDPPALTSQRMQLLHGREQLGSEQECRPISPNCVSDFLARLADVGVNVPQEVWSSVEGSGAQGRNLGGQGETGVDSASGSGTGSGSGMGSRTGTGTGAGTGSLSGSEFLDMGSQPAEGSGAQGEGVSSLCKKSVSFSVENVLGDVETDSNAPGTTEPGFRPVAKVIYDLHPHSVPSTSKGVSRECDFERIYAVSAKDQKEYPKFNLYPKVGEILEQVRQKFSASVAQGKVTTGPMPGRKRKYEAPDTPSLGSAPNFNPNLARLMDNVSPRRSLSFSFEDCGRVESLVRHQLEINSLVFWLFSSLIKVLNGCGFEPEDPIVFEGIIYNLTLGLINSTSISSSVSSFLQLKRREGLLSHLPPHVVSCHREDLLASPLSSPLLFDPETLTRVIQEVKDDSSTSTMVSVSRMVSLPSFSAMRSSRKASSGVPAAGRDQVASGSGRGRGRGQQNQGQAVGRGVKHKAGNFSGGSVSKSPRRGARSPKGRGFSQ